MKENTVGTMAGWRNGLTSNLQSLGTTGFGVVKSVGVGAKTLLRLNGRKYCFVLQVKRDLFH